MEKLLALLALNGGTIVSSASCTELEIAQARACDRMYINEQGLGFIYMPQKATPEIVPPHLRRLRLDLMQPAEKAILKAMEEVEKLPADERLTEAVILLATAKNHVSDYIDGII